MALFEKVASGASGAVPTAKLHVDQFAMVCVCVCVCRAGTATSE